MSDTAQPTRFVVVGGGSAGWMAAAALARHTGGRGDITLVESDAIGTVGVGEATIPPIREFNASLGIKEAEFVARTAGSFKLGIQFRDWGRLGERYFHPFGTYGVDFDPVPVHQHFLAAHRAGEAAPLDDYCMAWAMAQKGRFSPPSADRRTVQSTFDYAYHFDTGLYAAFLRDYAEKTGVRRVEGRVVDVAQDARSGYVTGVALESGQRIEGDVFLDCSGFRGLLIGGAMDVPYHDWKRWLPVDRAVAVGCEGSSEPIPYTIATAREAGWQWRIPLQHRTGNGYVYCSDHLDADRAEATLLANLDGAPLGRPKHLRFTTGRRDRFWTKNVVAIGLSAGFMEPLESTSLHLIQTAIRRFVALLPNADCDPALADEFNRITVAEYESIRDFLILHYCATKRDDAPLWNHVRTMELPDTLTVKMEHYRRDGRLVSDGIELFANPSWIAVYHGQGVVPERPDPLLAIRGLASGRANLEHLREVMAKTADTLPTHGAFLARHAPYQAAA